MKIHKYLLTTGLFVCIVGSMVLGQSTETYYYLPLRQLEIQGQWPDQQQPSSSQLNWRNRQYLKYYMPYAAGDKGEEMYIDFTTGTLGNQISSTTQLLDGAYIAIKTDRDLPLAGTVYLPKPDLSGMAAVKFTIPKQTAVPEQESAKGLFYTAMARHYDFLQNNNFTGTAWFRYRAGLARQILEKDKPFTPNEIPQGGQVPSRDPYEDIMSLFTGQKAIGENIQLDRTLQTRINELQTIEISSIEGITTAQIDWKALTAGVNVTKDPLARYIPADQHAIFYPEFKSMVVLMDELKGSGFPLEQFSRSVRNIEWYEQQMCVWLDGWSRFWGPKTIRGVALTGSDPYLEAGTDSAILFDARIAQLVYGNTESKQQEALKKVKDARKITGSIEGIDYQAVVSPDRAVCSYLAKIDNVVVVTNSPVQLEKIIQTSKSRQPAVADLDEYVFFRSRYPADEDKQTALVIMTDAAIRRWCSPRWRIGAARRTLMAAVLSQMQAEYLDAPAKFDLAAAQKTAQGWAKDIGEISLTEAGITSSVYGNLRFMTPIAELSIDKVSELERSQYTRFRENYQRQWRNFFDPIGVSFLITPEEFDLDMTIRPLIAASEYRQYIQVGGKNTLQPGDGDPHPQTLLQAILAIDSDSEPLGMAGGITRPMAGPEFLNANPLGWLGRWITIYADEDPFWNELARHINSSTADSELFGYLEQNIHRLPLALVMDVDSPVQMTLFLVGLRAFIEQTAPNMTAWEMMNWNEQAYTKITFRYDAQKPNPPSLYYAALPDRLILTPNEALLKQAIDRSRNSKTGQPKGKQPVSQWLGKNLSAQVSQNAWTVIEMMAFDSYSRYLQMQSWNHLPILREWRTRKGDISESDFHLQYWHTKLACPGGGKYVWNPQFNTFESTVFGHPARPKVPDKLPTPLTKTKNVQLGISFEGDGLRGRTEIERKK